MQSKFNAFKSKSRIRSTFLILTAIAFWVILPYFLQFGATVSHADENDNLPNLVAVLSGAPATTTAASGLSTYFVRTVGTTTVRELNVNVQGVTAPTGTQLGVFLNTTQIGMMMLDSTGRAHLTLSTATPNTTVPMVVSGNTLSVKNGAATVASGIFSAPATPSPTVSPSHSPTGTPIPSTHLFASLSGSAIGGIVPRGIGVYETEGTGRELNVFINYVNLPNNTALSVMLGNSLIGSITVNNRSGRLELSTEDGGTVPTVTNGAVLTLKMERQPFFREHFQIRRRLRLRTLRRP